MKAQMYLLVTILLLFTGAAKAQVITQTVKGKVYDKVSQSSLPGATILIKDTDPARATITDSEGSFRIEKVPVGRYNIEIRTLGYTPVSLTEILVGSGKEVVLNVEMVESVENLVEVTVKAHVNKDKPLNSMATISARSFNVEETRRYAGGMDDPARLATAFAGVSSGGNNQDNAIVIRGNAPKTVLWRVEGVDINNPSHFSGANVAGGGFVTVLSSQMLANSDFYTGAFPAEYGNALGGVFDIKLRTGNNERHEKTFQIGVMGIDVASEGPFKKGKSASYLFNYRYSTLGLFTKLKMIPTEQIPIYQDLSFKLNFPTQKAGVFSLWGLGGIDNLSDKEEPDPSKWETTYDGVRNNWDERFGALGLSHKYSLNKNTLISSSIVATGNKKDLTQSGLNEELVMKDEMDLKSTTDKISLNVYANHKFNARLNTRTGFNINTLFYTYNLSGTMNEDPDTYRNFANDSGESYHLQAFTEMKYKLSNTLSVNGGINAEHFVLTGKTTIDPRFSLSWDINPNQSLSLGYGKHSQLEDLSVYFFSAQVNGQEKYLNKDLGFSHAHHVVLGYDCRINEHLRLKVEPYYQYLYNIPGIANTTFSMINYRQDLAFQSELKNNSKGRNLGVDITFERFLNDNFYYMVTTSLFDSKYKADDGIWRDTRYNKKYVVNFLGGKEFVMGKKKNNLLGVNLRGVISGGEYNTPIDEAASRAVMRPIPDEKNAFSEKDGLSKFVNLSITYRINKARHSSIWAFQLNNMLGEKQYDKYEYNIKKDSFERPKSVYRMPMISYKIEF